MPRISGTGLAGAAVCLGLLCAAPAIAQTPGQYTTVPVAPTPLSPETQPPITTTQPALQPQPTTQAQPYQGSRSAPPRYIPHGLGRSAAPPLNTPNGTSPAPANAQNLPMQPSPVMPTPKLLDDMPPKSEATATKPATYKAKKHKATHHKTRHKKSTKKASHTSGKSHIRTAQVYLDQLGYDPGPTDGIMGRKTKSAIKEFQRDHDLRATGTLTAATFAALEKEAGSRNPAMHGPQPQPDFVATHPDFYGYYGNEGISPTSLASPQGIPSRFGNLQIDQQQNGQTSNYTISVNGRQIYHADNQPSYIDVSRTFAVDDTTDAVVLTAYDNGNITCPYQHQLLVIKSSGSNVRSIADCTHDFEAYTENGMLMITFPGSHVDGMSNGALWRYDHGTFEKL